MIRFILQNKCRHRSGAEYAQLFTLDADVPELEQMLKRGGLSEDIYDIMDVIGVEIIEQPTTNRRER